jgi:hypothetical protein
MNEAQVQWGPGKRAFYKYVTPEAAIAILKSRSVRHSSPLLFNDPFDIQSGLHFDFDLSTLHAKVLDRLGELAAARDEPPVDPEDVWGKVVLAARAYYADYGFPRQRWSEMSAPLFQQLVGIIEDTQQRYRAHWREKLLPSIRVFCVTEDRDNLLMWAHYAKDHTGAVLELWSLPEADNPLSVATPVIYRSSPPPFFTEEEWLDDLMAVKKLDMSALYRRYALVKSDHWTYEKEWRVWYPLASTTEMYDTAQLREGELGAMYFGCRAANSFIDEARQVLRSSFPNARSFRAVKSEVAYEISYEEI